MNWPVVSILLLTLGAVACSPPAASRGGFDSPDPASLLYAINRAGESNDSTHLPELVTALEHDDPAVRMMAIVALEKITGTRLDYSPYGTSPARHQAVARWQQAVHEGRFTQPENADENARMTTRATSLDSQH